MLIPIGLTICHPSINTLLLRIVRSLAVAAGVDIS